METNKVSVNEVLWLMQVMMYCIQPPWPVSFTMKEATSKVKYWQADDYQQMGLQFVQLHIHILHRIFQPGA
jgi:hypothetical protein